MLPVLPDSVEGSCRIGTGSVTAVNERPQCGDPGPSGRGSWAATRQSPRDRGSGAATRQSPSNPLRSSKSGK
jgi:hypothetical protein